MASTPNDACKDCDAYYLNVDLGETQTQTEKMSMRRHLLANFGGSARRGEHAFTFVELLVAIATLAVLAMVLIPALARSDDNGARMVCLHNLRQMGMASNMYAGDNQDHLPYPNWDGGSDATAPRGWLYSMNPNNGLPPAFPGGTIPSPYSSVAPYSRLAYALGAWQSGLWFQYVQNTKSYLCPVDTESKDYLPSSSLGGRANKLSSYVMNGAVNGFPSGGSYPLPCKITDIWSPACYLLWEPDENADGQGSPGALEYNDGANFPSTSEGIGRLHSANSGNMLCVGGNVQFVTVLTFKAQSVTGSGPGPGGKTLAWWYPGAGNGN